VNEKEYVMTIGKRITAALGVLATTAVLFLTGAGTSNAALADNVDILVNPLTLSRLDLPLIGNIK
jgi:hypothetical protein